MPESRNYPVRYVEVAGNKLGHLINRPGETFDLRNLFSSELGMYLGGDKFSIAYFRTDSDNIYRIDEWGRLINRRRSLERDKLDIVQLDTESLQEKQLKIGLPFNYITGRTTPLTEIVPITNRVYVSTFLQEVTEARRSSIIEEFLFKLSRDLRHK